MFRDIYVRIDDAFFWAAYRVKMYVALAGRGIYTAHRIKTVRPSMKSCFEMQLAGS